jgi:hypothetical protein
MYLRRFLLQHQEHLGPAAGQSLQQLGLLGPARQGSLVLLEPHTPTLLAYEKLAAAGVTGAPVLSSDGQIIANLSASDIRCEVVTDADTDVAVCYIPYICSHMPRLAVVLDQRYYPVFVFIAEQCAHTASHESVCMLSQWHSAI